MFVCLAMKIMWVAHKQLHRSFFLSFFVHFGSWAVQPSNIKLLFWYTCFLKQTIDHGKITSQDWTLHTVSHHIPIYSWEIYSPMVIQDGAAHAQQVPQDKSVLRCQHCNRKWIKKMEKCQRFINLFWLKSIWTKIGFIMPRRNHCRLLKPQRVLQNVEYSLVHDRQHVTEQ